MRYKTKVILLVNFWSKLYSKSFTSDCTIERGPQIGAPFNVPSYLVHPLVVPSIRFHTLVSNAYDAPSLCSVAGGCSLTSLSRWGMLPRFAQSLGDTPSLRSVTGGCSFALLSHWGDAPLLRSVTGGCSLASLICWGMLPHFAQSLGRGSLALLSHWGDAPSLRSVAFHSMVPPNCSKICILEGQQSSIFTFGSLIVGTSIR